MPNNSLIINKFIGYIISRYCIRMFIQLLKWKVCWHMQINKKRLIKTKWKWLEIYALIFYCKSVSKIISLQNKKYTIIIKYGTMLIRSLCIILAAMHLVAKTCIRSILIAILFYKMLMKLNSSNSTTSFINWLSV